MASPAEQRRYKRLDTKWVVRLRLGAAGFDTRRRIQEIITDVSLGGVFIDSRIPYETGSIVEFDFTIPGSPAPVHARGVVRWSNDGRLAGRARGMGIEFLELSSDGRESLSKYVLEESASRLLGRLTRTTLHQHLLRIYAQRIGSAYLLDVLAPFLGCTAAALRETLNDFAAAGLASVDDGQVRFLPAKDETDSQVIGKWAREAGPAPAPPGKVPS